MFANKLREEFSILWPFYIYLLLFGIACAVSAPVYILFYLNSGLSFAQIGIIFGVSLVIGFLAEIPTGAVADVFGRKFSVALSFLLWGITLILIPLFPSFYPLLIIVSLAELFSTLRSGADNAWAVDLLKHKKKSSLVQNFFINKTVSMNLGMILGGFVSVFVVTYFGIPSTWIFQGLLVIFISGFIFLFGEEWFIKKKANIFDSVNATFVQAKKSLTYVRKHKVLFFYVVGTCFLALLTVFNIVWQPIFVEIGISPSTIGIVVSMLGVIGLVAPVLSKKFLSVFKTEKTSIIMAYTITVAAMVLFSFVRSPFEGILIFAIASAVIDMSSPIESKFVHTFIKSKQRATIGSILNMNWKFSACIGFIVNGFVIDVIGIRSATMLIGLVASIGLLFLLMMKPEGQKKHF
jgi:MFS family permease